MVKKKANTKRVKAHSEKTIATNEPMSSCHSHSTHDSKEQHFPSHGAQKRRLNRIKGQLEGIEKMIDNNRYCLDIIFQMRAAASAMQALEKEIMHTHIKSCVKSAIESNDQFEANDKIDEIMEFF